MTSEDKIRAMEQRLQKTGMPLEIRISSLLDKKWVSVQNQDTFVDSDSGKLREIDICASLAPKRIHNLELETNLVVECKQMEKLDWVFFTRPFKFEFTDIAGQYSDEVQMAANNTGRDEIMRIVLQGVPLHYILKERKAVTFSVVNMSGEKKSEVKELEESIHTAREQVKSYVCCAIEQDVKERISALPYTIEMYFPCIVFRGSESAGLYEAAVEDDKVRLKETDHVILSTLYKSAFSTYEKSVLIDVVSEKYFSKYEEIVEKDIQNIINSIETHAERLSERIEEIVMLLESSVKSKHPY